MSAANGTGYFDQKAGTQPLLHIWSLAVEEQFYLLFPVLLWLAWRTGVQTARALVWLLAIASFAYAVAVVDANPDAAFHFSWARAYELLAGVILATGAVPHVERRQLRDALSIVGLAMIAIAITVFDEGTRLPGYAALLPIIGSALVIAAGEAGPSLGGRLLSWRPLVLLGSLSYSLYLCHWPILVFQTWIDLAPPSAAERAGAVVLSLGIAWLSWRYVERPALAGSWRRGYILTAGAGAMAVGAALTLPLIGLHGLPQRFSPAALAMLDAQYDVSPHRSRCMASGERPLPYAQNCTFGAPVPPSIAVWGDSFASELAVAAGERAAARGKAVMEITQVGCPPTIGFVYGGRGRCRAVTNTTLSSLIADRRIHTVMLVLNYRRYPDQAGLLDGLVRTATALHAAGKQIVLLDPVPGVPFPAPSALLLVTARGGDRPRTVGHASTMTAPMPRYSPG